MADNQSRFQQPHFEWARQGRISAIAMFLDTGGDIDAKNDKGQSLLSLAVTNGHFPLTYWLVSRGAEVNCIDIFGNTPVMIAACRRDAKTVEMLIGTGADPSLQNVDGMSAFDFARKNQDSIVFRLLMQDPHSPRTKIEKIVGRLAKKLITGRIGRTSSRFVLQ
jgi:ankyrin repeat protein